MTDPLQVVRDALDRAGCAPHGPACDFRARCPGHDGDNPESLHVCEGADRRVVLYCFAHLCDAERIVSAIGLTLADLFPAGHHRARRRDLPEAQRRDFGGNARIVANMLLALERLGRDWQLAITLDCPYCGELHAQVVVGADGKPWAHCAGACTARTIECALADQIGGGS